MQSKKMLLIGSYSPENEGKPEIIDRDYYRQGWIFKDEDAFQNRPDDVCYIPELSDEKYTRNDILKILAGDERTGKDNVRGAGLAASRKSAGRLESKWRNCLVSALYRICSDIW